MLRNVTIKHVQSQKALNEITTWFSDNNYEFEITGASNSPSETTKLTGTVSVNLYTEEAELATRLTWHVL